MKLNQIVAIEKGLKSRVCSEISNLHKMNQKTELFNGFVKTYMKKDEEGEDYPQEKKKVQIKSEDAIEAFSKALTELFDTTAIKDYANCHAFANITVNGRILVESAPLPFILFLEKQVNDIRTFIEALPVLDESEDWNKDDNSGLYKTEPIQTHRTKKVIRPIILAEATKEHPAQTQLINDDIVVGYWNTVKYSGSIPIPHKKKILEKIELFSQAIKFSREQANSEEVEQKKIGSTIFDYLFNNN